MCIERRSSEGDYLKKYKLVILAFLISIFFSFGTGMIVKAENVPDKIKVGLKYASTAVSAISVESDNGFKIGMYSGSNFQPMNSLQSVNKLIIKRNVLNNNIDVEDGTGKLIASYNLLNPQSVSEKDKYVATNYLKIQPFSGDNDGVIKIGTQKYRGSALFNVTSQTTMNVINELGFEQYLYGVVPSEVSASWNKQALKAQAVAARTYALFNMNKHKKYGFNVCSDTDCQAYGGLKAEYPSTNSAVDETKGQMIYYNNKIIDAVFFATSGGRTEDSSNVWSGDIPYLKGVEDSLEPASVPRETWTKVYTSQEIEDILKAKNVNIGDVTDITINQVSANGRVLSLTFVGTKGSKTYTKTSISSVLKLFSTYFTIQKANGIDASSTASNEAVDTDKKQGSLAPVPDQSGVKGQGSNTPTPSIYFPNAEDIAFGKYTILGRGWGHGVGMSQNGAQGMAQSGKDYITILKHYYTGVEVK